MSMSKMDQLKINDINVFTENFDSIKTARHRNILGKSKEMETKIVQNGGNVSFDISILSFNLLIFH